MTTRPAFTITSREMKHAPRTKTLEFESLVARYEYVEGSLHVYRANLAAQQGLKFTAGEIEELRAILKSIGKEVNE